MNSLIIINDAPYGNERCYNALRLAQALLRPEGASVEVFLLADAVTAARSGQKTPEGYYNVELMLTRLLRGNARLILCGTCMDARGITEELVIKGAARSSMAELADLVAAADKVLVF